MRRKGKSRMVITVIAAFSFLVAAVMGGAVLYTSAEHKEARALPIASIDFSKLQDGTYDGEYAGGMKKWRTNAVQVTVDSGKVTRIRVIEQKYKLDPEFTNKLYDRVINAQSLQVDTISGATLTSKACLKSIEDALIKAQNK